MARFHRHPTHWLPVAQTRTSIIWNRMAFRALLCSKSPETNTAMTAACKNTGVRAEVCSDIFTAIEKGKTQAYSCIIADWADQPEASFLLKRARESGSNRTTVAIAIVDNEPTAAEMRDNRLDFLIYRPISPEEADAVLAKACEQMQPANVHDMVEPPRQSEANASAGSGGANQSDQEQQDHSNYVAEQNTAEGDGEVSDGGYEEPKERTPAIGVRGAVAAVLLLAAVFCVWRSREVIQYLSSTHEGRVRVLKESVAAL